MSDDQSLEPATSENAPKSESAAEPESAPKPDTTETGRRKFPRARIDLVVSLRFQSVQQFLDAKAEDISVGGMFLRSEHAGPGGQLRKVGQLLVLKFDAGNQRVVEGLGRVVRVVTPDEPGMVAGVGIEFLDLDERSTALIAAIIAIKTVKPFEG